MSGGKLHHILAQGSGGPHLFSAAPQDLVHFPGVCAKPPLLIANTVYGGKASED